MAITELETGEYFSGSLGIYVGEKVISLAEEFGFKVEPEDPDRFVDGENYYELLREAEEFLNELLREAGDPRGFGPGPWEDGSWGLWEPDEE